MHLATWMEVQISSVFIFLGPPPFFTTFSLQILDGRFLWAITSRQKSNFSD